MTANGTRAFRAAFFFAALSASMSSAAAGAAASAATGVTVLLCDMSADVSDEWRMGEWVPLRLTYSLAGLKSAPEKNQPSHLHLEGNNTRTPDPMKTVLPQQHCRSQSSGKSPWRSCSRCRQPADHRESFAVSPPQNRTDHLRVLAGG